MTIERVTKLRSFRNEYQKASLNVLFSANWIEDRMKAVLEPENITLQQYNILRILQHAGKPLSTLQIRQRMLDKMSDTSRIVDRLLKKELVEKKTSEEDKRLVDITITEKGMILLTSLDEKIDEIDNILNKITSEEARLLNRLLDKMRGCFE